MVLIHVPYFLKSPLATAAPRQDRDLWFDLGEYKKCFDDSSVQNAMINAAQESLKNHMWYRTIELVVLGLFDDELSVVEKKEIADTILTFSRPNRFHTGKPSFSTELMCDMPSLSSFIGPRSWLLFGKFDQSRRVAKY